MFVYFAYYSVNAERRGCESKGSATIAADHNPTYCLHIAGEGALSLYARTVCVFDFSGRSCMCTGVCLYARINEYVFHRTFGYCGFLFY